MSRAFTKELDGWNFCKSHQRECSDAAFNGRCELSECKFRTESPVDPAAAKTGAEQSKANPGS